jgi:hypothetical protein
MLTGGGEEKQIKREIREIFRVQMLLRQKVVDN